MQSAGIRIVITGSTGLIGSHVRDFLQSEDFEVYCPARNEILDVVKKIKPSHIINCIGAGMDHRKNQSEDAIWLANLARNEIAFKKSGLYIGGPKMSEAAKVAWGGRGF